MKRLENLTYGEALEYAKKGFAIQRIGWNGKKMFVSVVHEKEVPLYELATDDPFGMYFASIGKSHIVKSGFLAMKSADDKIVRGWLASQDDMLKSDWQVVDPITFNVLTAEGVAE